MNVGHTVPVLLEPRVLTIAKRELTSLFYSPIAYVVLGVFAIVSTLLFLMHYGPGEPADLRGQSQWIVWLMVFLVPAISMRLVSEEYRSGTIEPLMTAPVSDSQVIVGKWLGAMGFVLVLLSPLLVHVLLLEFTANPDYGPIFTVILGLIAVGGFYLAIGTFASAATQNQIIAFLITVFITGFLTIGLYALSQWSIVTGPVREAMFFLNVDRQFDDFSKGLIDTSNFVYFLSGIGFFLFLAVMLLQSRRWR